MWTCLLILYDFVAHQANSLSIVSRSFFSTWKTLKNDSLHLWSAKVFQVQWFNPQAANENNEMEYDGIWFIAGRWIIVTNMNHCSHEWSSLYNRYLEKNSVCRHLPVVICDGSIMGCLAVPRDGWWPQLGTMATSSLWIHQTKTTKTAFRVWVLDSIDVH